VREVLKRCGLPDSEKLQVAADAGYFCERDLRFAANNQQWVDLLIAEGETGGAHRGKTKYFDRTRFEIRSDGTAICPAGRLMSGPKVDKGERVRYEGKGCTNCELRPQCTGVQKRNLSIHPEMDHRAHGPGAPGKRRRAAPTEIRRKSQTMQLRQSTRSQSDWRLFVQRITKGETRNLVFLRELSPDVGTMICDDNVGVWSSKMKKDPWHKIVIWRQDFVLRWLMDWHALLPGVGFHAVAA